jgi:hypothetical protein
LTIMKAAYPNFYKDANFDEETFTINRALWQNAFKEIPYQEVFNAFNYWLSIEKWPPTLADINKIVKQFRNPEAFISAETAWEQVSNAVRKFGWPNEAKAMETLAPNVRRAIQYIGGWQKLCSSSDKEWDFRRKDFIDVYDEFETETKEQVLIPEGTLEKLRRTIDYRNEQRQIEGE